MSELKLYSPDNQLDKTTALLDIAISNARRGLDVIFLSYSYQNSDNAFNICCELIPESDIDVQIYRGNGNQQIKYPKGRIRFVASEAQILGIKTDIKIFDEIDGPGVISK